jgi:RNA polymerase sigma-70 factor (ECF subfamily)
VGLLSDEARLGAPEAGRSAHARVASLVGSHFDFVWQLLRRFGLRPADADDAAQQVFMIVARRLDSIEPGRERAFLYGTTRRVVANALRDMKRRREVGDDDVVDEPTEENLPDELVEQRRARSLLDELLGELPDELRRVLVLAEIEGLAAPEIAALEDVPLGTVASRLRRARSTFRELLAARRANNPFERGND